MKIKHVFFDLDHTLWDFEKNSALAFQKVFENYNLTIDYQQFIDVYKPINKAYWKLYRDEKVTKDDLRYNRLKDSFDALNYFVTDEVIHNISIDYIDILPNYNHLFEGTIEILQYLQSKYQLHIITNGFDEVQSKKMNNSNINHFFDKIITAESVGVKKPNPLIFKYALQITNAQANESIMIGDSLEADILGAKDVGFQTIFCAFEYEEEPPNGIYTIYNLMEIKQYL